MCTLRAACAFGTANGAPCSQAHITVPLCHIATGRTVTAVATHLKAGAGAANVAVRTAQGAELARHVAALRSQGGSAANEAPPVVIVCGDLNDTPESPCLHALTAPGGSTAPLRSCWQDYVVLPAADAVGEGTVTGQQRSPVAVTADGAVEWSAAAGGQHPVVQETAAPPVTGDAAAKDDAVCGRDSRGPRWPSDIGCGQMGGAEIGVLARHTTADSAASCACTGSMLQAQGLGSSVAAMGSSNVEQSTAAEQRSVPFSTWKIRWQRPPSAFASIESMAGEGAPPLAAAEDYSSSARQPPDRGGMQQEVAASGVEGRAQAAASEALNGQQGVGMQQASAAVAGRRVEEKQATIDHVLYTREAGLRVDAFRELPGKTSIGRHALPSAEWPSDHLPLVVRFRLPPP